MASLKGKCGWTDRHGKVEYSTRAFNRKVDQRFGEREEDSEAQIQGQFCCLLAGWSSLGLGLLTCLVHPSASTESCYVPGPAPTAGKALMARTAPALMELNSWWVSQTRNR